MLHIINMFAKDQITSVRRLCTFYWEREEIETDQPTEDVIAQLQEEMRRMNENNGFQQ